MVAAAQKGDRLIEVVRPMLVRSHQLELERCYQMSQKEQKDCVLMAERRWKELEVAWEEAMVAACQLMEEVCQISVEAN